MEWLPDAAIGGLLVFAFIQLSSRIATTRSTVEKQLERKRDVDVCVALHEGLKERHKEVLDRIDATKEELLRAINSRQG